MNKSASTDTAEVASPELDERINESIAKAVPVALSKFFSSGGVVVSQDLSIGSGASDSSSFRTEDSNRAECLYATEEDTELSSELLNLTTKAFTWPLSRDKWMELFASYPQLTDGFMGALTMEAGMKETIRKSHGFRKTKDVLASDGGLAEQEVPWYR